MYSRRALDNGHMNACQFYSSAHVPVLPLNSLLHGCAMQGRKRSLEEEQKITVAITNLMSSSSQQKVSPGEAFHILNQGRVQFVGPPSCFKLANGTHLLPPLGSHGYIADECRDA